MLAVPVIRITANEHSATMSVDMSALVVEPQGARAYHSGLGIACPRRDGHCHYRYCRYNDVARLKSNLIVMSLTW